MAALELEGHCECIFGGGFFVDNVINVDFAIYIEIVIIFVNQHIIHEVNLQSGQAL